MNFNQFVADRYDVPDYVAERYLSFFEFVSRQVLGNREFYNALIDYSARRQLHLSNGMRGTSLDSPLYLYYRGRAQECADLAETWRTECKQIEQMRKEWLMLHEPGTDG